MQLFHKIGSRGGHRRPWKGTKAGTTVLLSLLLLSSCLNKPKETEPVSILVPIAGNPGDIISRDLHEVVVREIIPAGNYVYLKVAEGEKLYWIASGNRHAEAGKSYYYREALLKTNFESKITGNTFDTLYLVTQLVPKAHALGAQHPDN